MKVLLHTLTNTISKYPRADDEDVVGLDEEFLILDVQEQEIPEFDPSEHKLVQTSTIDAENKILLQGWILEEIIPTVPDPIDVGYLVEPEGFTLALGDLDRAAFTAMLTLVQEALSLGLINNDTPQTIADKDGSPHIITTIRFRQIMVGYGFFYKTLWDNRNVA